MKHYRKNLKLIPH